MSLNITSLVCNVEPFRYQSTPQPGADDGASGNQINEQALEDYLERLRRAICDDLNAIIEAAGSGGGGASSFLELTDTPDSYSGAAGEIVAVNGAETGLEFIEKIDEFIELTDTPSNYSGAANQIVAVNGAETGLVFVATPPSANSSFARLIVMWPGNNNSAGFTFGDGAAQSGTTTVTESTSAATNMIQASPRTVKTTAGAAGQTANSRTTGTGFLVQAGTAPNIGGYRLTWRFGNTTTKAAVAQQSAFVGLFNSGAAIGNVDPSSHTNVVFFGYDPADTNWFFMHNDGAGTCARVDLGANFPIDATTLYEGTITCNAGSTDVTYHLRNMDTGDVATGTVTTEVPASGLRGVPQIWIGNRGTAAVAGIAHVFMSLESGQL